MMMHFAEGTEGGEKTDDRRASAAESTQGDNCNNCNQRISVLVVVYLYLSIFVFVFVCLYLCICICVFAFVCL